MSTHDHPNEATVISTSDLAFLNARAIATQRNRALSDEIMGRLDPDGVHLVAYSMVHNDVEVRVALMLKISDQEEPIYPVFLDMTFDDFFALTKIRQTDDGEWEVVR